MGDRESVGDGGVTLDIFVSIGAMGFREGFFFRIGVVCSGGVVSVMSYFRIFLALFVDYFGFENAFETLLAKNMSQSLFFSG